MTYTRWIHETHLHVYMAHTAHRRWHTLDDKHSHLWVTLTCVVSDLRWHTLDESMKHTYMSTWHTLAQPQMTYTIGWRRPMGCLKLQVIFRKKATHHRAFLRGKIHNDKASYGSLPPCRWSYDTHVHFYMAHTCASRCTPLYTMNNIYLTRFHTHMCYNLLYLECDFFVLISQSMIRVSKSLLPRSVEKRPVGLRLEIGIEWHSKRNSYTIVHNFNILQYIFLFNVLQYHTVHI